MSVVYGYILISLEDLVLDKNVVVDCTLLSANVFKGNVWEEFEAETVSVKTKTP